MADCKFNCSICLGSVPDTNCITFEPGHPPSDFAIEASCLCSAYASSLNRITFVPGQIPNVCALEIQKQACNVLLNNINLYTTVGSFGTYVGLAAAIANEKMNINLTGIGIMPFSSNPEEEVRSAKKRVLNPYNEMKEFYSL